MSVLATTSGATILWYLARGSGLAALVVLTMSVILGIVTTVRWSSDRWPRFVIELLHRNSSLIAFGLIVVHIATIVLDGFAPIGWKDAVIPFASPYRTLWLGLGSVSFDVLLALLVTSLLRHRIGHRTWRFVHWFAYLCWPLAVVHGIGTGSDTQVTLALGLTLACVGAVILALWWRLAVGWPDHRGVRVAAIVVSLVAPVVLVLWLGAGPLAAGWARKAGTPASVLERVSPTSGAGSGGPLAASPGNVASLPAPPYTVQVAGSSSESAAGSDGRVTVRLAMAMTGAATGPVEVDLIGQPVEGGGVALERSGVRLGTSSNPSLYTGAVTSISGQEIDATVTDAGRHALLLVFQVQPEGNRVAGTLQVQAGSLGGDGDGGQ